MNLRKITLADFQSYRAETTVQLDPALTLVAGRNDVGKSALLRALRMVAEPQDGIGPNFHIAFTWFVSQHELLGLSLLPGTSAIEFTEWLRTHENYALEADFVADPQGPANNLFCRRIVLPELSAVAEGELGTTIGWNSGPWAGSSIAVELMTQAAKSLAGMVSFVTPRRVELGPQQLFPQNALLPDARNLTNVVAYLVQNEGTTIFPRLQAFIQEAFPEVLTVGARLIGAETGAQQNELHVYYRGREGAPVPLRLCGTGIEQMLAVATGVYTAATPRLFLVDEPQAYLHPHAERSLLRLLDENPQHQYLIATHSAVFLNARPLSQARLITISNGASEIADVPSPGALLGEIGVTAADLWLSDAILWVEGASDVSMLELLSRELLGPPSRGVAIRAMPDASRFSSKSRIRAEQTFRFCEAVIDAMAPLPVRTLFLFDKNEKSDALCEEIKVASRGKARFLPVRELENLFLEPEVIANALIARCEALGLQAPSIEAVRAAFDGLLASLDDRRLYPRKPSGAESAVEVIVGSELLDRLYWEFSKSSYNKVADGRRLASLSVAEGVSLPAIRDLFEELMT